MNIMLPQEVRDQLTELIEFEELECADNYRFALDSDKDQVDAYYDQRERGCCGYADYQVQDNQGRVWLVGCNYGH